MAISRIERTEVVTAEPDAAITDIVGTMADEEVGSVVITEDDDVRGIVTLDDVIVLLSTEFGNVDNVIEKQSPRF